MNLEDCRKAYDYFTGKASDLIRKLSFSGMAIIWVFRVETETGLVVSDDLILPGFLIVLTLSFDLLQYLSGSLAWGVYHRYKELSLNDREETFKAPRWINWPTNTFFIFKVLAIGIGYYLILIYLYDLFL